MKRLLFFLMISLYFGAMLSPVMAEKNDGEATAEHVGSAIAAYVATALSIEASEVSVEALSPMNGQKHIQRGQVLKVRAANRNHLLGRAIFVVNVAAETGDLFEQWMSADVSQLVNVVVAGRKLRRLDVIQRRDIQIQPMRLRRMRSRYLYDPQEVLGKRLTQSLRKGMPIRGDQLEIAPLVRRGDRVTITLRSQGLQIVTSGKAKQDGQLGEMIRVMNLDSKKTVFAEVMNSGDVQIILNAKD